VTVAESGWLFYWHFVSDCALKAIG
jgi:hypothetical protein